MTHEQFPRIVGIGSPHGADRAGWLVAERLRHRWTSGPMVQVLNTPLQLLDHLSECRSLLIIDACQAGLPAGSVIRLEWPDPRIREQGSLSSHGWGVGMVLELADRLGRLPDSVILFGLEVSTELTTAENERTLPDDFPGLANLEQAILSELAGYGLQSG